MNDTSETRRVQRIAVTLDAFDVSAGSLEQAMRLAVSMGAQIEGIFVEDTDLLRLAEMPFIREVRSVSRSEAVMDLARMEQEFRVLARRAESRLRELAARHNVTCSFRIWRGSIESELLGAAIEADVLALTRPGAKLVYLPVTRPARNRIAVLFDGSKASGRALDTAAQLAREPNVSLDVLLSASGDSSADELQQQAHQRLGERAADVVFVSMADLTVNALLDRLAGNGSSALIINRGNALLQAPDLRSALERLDCLLLIVR